LHLVTGSCRDFTSVRPPEYVELSGLADLSLPGVCELREVGDFFGRDHSRVIARLGRETGQ
jgi:hypothetical protein